MTARSTDVRSALYSSAKGPVVGVGVAVEVDALLSTSALRAIDVPDPHHCAITLAGAQISCSRHLWKSNLRCRSITSVEK